MAGKSATCSQCSAQFDYEPVLYDGRELFARKFCQSCTDILAGEAKDSEAQEVYRQREEKWKAVCPPIYRDTDPNRIAPRCAQAALGWVLGDGMGLGILGGTGQGKTRALFMALRRAFDAGKWCRAVSHNSFSRTVQNAFSGEGKDREEAKEQMKAFHRCSVLLLDDVGKPPPTERADAELEELIEVRTSNLLPILWSANGSSAWLIKRMGPDRGEPLVRRLSEFSTIVTV